MYQTHAPTSSNQAVASTVSSAHFDRDLFRRGAGERTPFSIDSLAAADTHLLPVTFRNGRVWSTCGAFSDVFRGRLNGERVAVKRMRSMSEQEPAPSSDSEDDAPEEVSRKWRDLAAMFWKETAILTRLRHRNILEFYGLCCYEKAICFVTPWVKYSSLLSYLNAKMDADVHDLVVQVTEALVYLHVGVGGTHIVHGDIHDNNVLVDTSDGDVRVVLCDFGLSKIVPKNHQASNSYDGSGGRDGWMLAPELQPTRDQVVRRSRRTDVFAFGALVYTAYNRKRPYPNTYTANIHLYQGHRPGRPDARDLTDPMWQLIQECWAQDPEWRPTMENVQARLPSC